MVQAVSRKKPRKSPSTSAGNKPATPKLYEFDAVESAIFADYENRGLSKAEAYAAIARYHTGGQNGVANLSQVDYTSPQRETMATVAKTKKTKGQSEKTRKPKSLQRFTLPEGDDLAARVARGLARWRAKHRMTIPAASRALKLNQTVWYRIESGHYAATAAKHIDSFCEATGMDVVELLKLGTPVWGDSDARSQPKEK